MALIQCKECKAEVSDTAKNCPKCGAKVPKKTGIGVKIFAVILGLGVLSAIIQGANAPAPVQLSAADAAAKVKQEAEFQSVVSKVRALKANAKNPATFEVEQVLLMDSGTLCVSYRAPNSFNAVVPESKAITSKGTFGNWDKECAGKSGTDYKRVRHAL
jgi:hypothetical protein